RTVPLITPGTSMASVGTSARSLLWVGMMTVSIVGREMSRRRRNRFAVQDRHQMRAPAALQHSMSRQPANDPRCTNLQQLQCDAVGTLRAGSMAFVTVTRHGTR